jgi:REP element-mobilizing transposase RayT
MSRLIYPIGYHITFGTYGTRLHGDERGTVDRSENGFGEPIVGADGGWQQVERSRLRFPPRALTVEQRLAVQEIVPQVCVRGGWDHVATAAAPDHVHQFVRATVEGTDVRKWLKRWLSQAISERWPLSPGEVWWAECGSVKWVWTDDYAERVTAYIERQRTTPPD